MKENKNYPGYVRKVFSYFDGCKQGGGLYLFRTLNAERTKYTAQDYNQMLFTIYNLVDQGYLMDKEGDFIVLTQDGYDYMQGGKMPYNKVNFYHSVKPSADSSQTNEQSDDEEMALALGDGTLASATTPQSPLLR